MNRQEKVKSVLMHAIIASTYANSFENLGRAHISSTLKKLDGFVDPLPALKGKEQYWRKPGQIPAIMQLMLTVAGLQKGKRFKQKEFMDLIAASPEINDYDYGPFRHPAKLEQYAIQSIKDNKIDSPQVPSARAMLLALPLAFESRPFELQLIAIIELVCLFSLNTDTIIGAVLAVFLLTELLDSKMPLDI